MTKRWTDLSADQIAALSLKNRASRVNLEDKRPGHMQVATAAVRDAQRDPDKPTLAELAKKRAAKRRYAPRLPETQVLGVCIQILESHPAVALWWRSNSGVAKFKERFVRFSFRGCSDLLFVLKGGRFGACECKATGKKPSADQVGFIANVNEAGGLALWCDDPATLQAALDKVI